MKVLNLYSGIGGNRKLWNNVEVTAVEINNEIAKIYKDIFPHDKVIVGDAHDYLLKHFNEYDFIWSSPPCPTHSQMRYRIGYLNDKVKAVYPDMSLYQEIILLSFHHKGSWVVENTESYYKPLIKPQKIGRHFIWSNVILTDVIKKREENIRWGKNEEREIIKDFDLTKYKIEDKRELLRNCVLPDLGLHIFNCIFKKKQIKLEVTK